MSNVKTTITFVKGDVWCVNKRCPYYQYYDGVMGLCDNGKDECTYKQTEEYKQEMEEEEERIKENEKFINYLTDKEKPKVVYYPVKVNGEYEPIAYIDGDSLDNKDWIRTDEMDSYDLCMELNNKLQKGEEVK